MSMTMAFPPHVTVEDVWAIAWVAAAYEKMDINANVLRAGTMKFLS
jgi:hypothetical protein